MPGRSQEVSIVLIFLDEERFIRESIESVLAQSLESWELLLVDDGSRDSSSSIAREYARQHPGRIRYLEHPGHRNQGMSASRNLGLGAAAGRYVTFLDADDSWAPAKLADQVAAMRAHPRAGFVCGPTLWWYSWSPEAAQRDFVQELGLAPDTLHEPPSLLTRFLKDERESPCDLLARRDVALAVGGYETSFRGVYEDQVFHTKLCLETPVVVAARGGYRYRQHPGSSTATTYARDGAYNEARGRFLDWVHDYCRDHAPADSPVWRSLRAQRRAIDPGIAIRVAGAGRRALALPARAVAAASARVRS